MLICSQMCAPRVERASTGVWECGRTAGARMAGARPGLVLAPMLSAPVLDTACVAGLQSLELELGLLLQSLERPPSRRRIVVSAGIRVIAIASVHIAFVVASHDLNIVPHPRRGRHDSAEAPYRCSPCDPPGHFRSEGKHPQSSRSAATVRTPPLRSSAHALRVRPSRGMLSMSTGRGRPARRRALPRRALTGDSSPLDRAAPTSQKAKSP
jgi:hypothetical protein